MINHINDNCYHSLAVEGFQMEQINTKLELGLKVTLTSQPFGKKNPPPKYFAITAFFKGKWGVLFRKIANYKGFLREMKLLMLDYCSINLARIIIRTSLLVFCDHKTIE
jgi:hypothetical protein